MRYSDTIDYLYKHLPMFQRTGPSAYKNSLANTLRLDELYGHPHKNYKTIHVAGTNGKGSVSHMLASVLQSAGFKTGLYTSPHLKDFRERIRVNGKMISKIKVTKWVEQFRVNNEFWKIEPSFFELTAALAFDYFSNEQVDVAVIEVGLGGRLDSTNIIQPEVSIITNIGLDHTNLLGNTYEQIASEKAGVIKPGVPAVIGVTQHETETVFRQKAQENNTEIFFADQEYKVEYATLNLEGKQVLKLTKNGRKHLEQLNLDLNGFYQHKNVPAVFKVLEVLKEKNWKISDGAIYSGLANVKEQTGLLGRWQIIGNNPGIVCDTGHNAEGIKEVVEQLKNTAYKNLHMVIGTVGDKNPDAVLQLLPKNARYYFTRADMPRSLNENELAEKAKQFGLSGTAYGSVKEAFRAAKKAAGKEDLIFVGGSTFVVAEVL